MNNNMHSYILYYLHNQNNQGYKVVICGDMDHPPIITHTHSTI